MRKKDLKKNRLHGKVMICQKIKYVLISVHFLKRQKNRVKRLIVRIFWQLLAKMKPVTIDFSGVAEGGTVEMMVARSGH